MDFLLFFGKVDTLFFERIDESALPFFIVHDVVVDIFGVFQIPTLRELFWVATGIPVDENPAIVRVQHMMLHAQINQPFCFDVNHTFFPPRGSNHWVSF
ncbi:hypothetical protein GPK77_02070 [Butyricicoccus faecihominis]|nr:hypothetical protein [Butyricicoccus faecihominis]MBT9816521.1 hypothetical protein [Butyricicoccus faecihominis]